jgi:hypothetical protein
MHFESNPEGWDQITKKVINEVGVPMMQKVADACNLELVLSAMKRGTVRGKARTSATARAQNVLAIGKGYAVGTEGSERLQKRDYRATVITASAAAMRHNGKRNTLIRNMHLAKWAFGGGDE